MPYRGGGERERQTRNAINAMAHLRRQHSASAAIEAAGVAAINQVTSKAAPRVTRR